MKTYIALFRGLNILGRNTLPMDELRRLMARAGCTDVTTYIQSGNAVFRSPGAASALAKDLRSHILRRRGFEPHVIVLTRSELERAAKANPFPQAEAKPTTVHLFFLSARPDNADVDALDAIKTASEDFVLKDKTFYLFTPDGFGQSKLAKRAERLLGVDATARNWRTVQTLVSLAKQCGQRSDFS